MDAKQRRTKARHDKISQDLEEAKGTIVTLSRDLLTARERLQPVLMENERATNALKEGRRMLADSEAVARVAMRDVKDLRKRLADVDEENTVLTTRLTAENTALTMRLTADLQQAKDAAAKEIAKLRRRLANREDAAEKAHLNRKAATVQPF